MPTNGPEPWFRNSALLAVTILTLTGLGLAGVALVNYRRLGLAPDPARTADAGAEGNLVGSA